MAKRKARQDSQKLVDPTSEAWRKLPWRKFEQHVYRIQKRIYRANQRGNSRAVHKLQKLLMKSEAARLLAVRRVTQENQGKKTAGIDGIKSVPPKGRLAMADQIHPQHWKHHTPKPVRRVWIQNQEKRKGGPWEYQPCSKEASRHWSNWRSNQNGRRGFSPIATAFG